jgi:hypothetical protein
MILCLGRQKMKVVLNGTLCRLLPLYVTTGTTTNLLSKDGYTLLDSEGAILYTIDSTASSNILMSSDNYMLLDFDSKKLII